MLSRSDRNTIKALAYRTGTDLYDAQSGKWFYYASKDVAHVELLLPQDAPQWAKDLQDKIARDRQAGIQEFSNLAEAAEKRKDSQVYRELEFALPKELTNEQNRILANEFLQDQACGLDMVVLPSFHFDALEDTGEGRPHCHAIFLTRTLDAEGLCATKETTWNQTSVLLTWRAQLANDINFHLKKHGHDVRVDHRSYQDQGIDLLPQPKLGRGVKIRDGKGRSTHVKRGRDQFEIQRQRNVAKIIDNPHVIFDMVTRQFSTFMWGDVERVLARYVKEEVIYRRLHDKLKTSFELVLLREEQRTNETGIKEDVSIYTTRSMLKSELSLVRLAEKMAAHQSHETCASEVEKAIKTTNLAFQAQDKGYSLSPDQVLALRHVTQGDQLSCVIGYAGAGKSTLFKTAALAWQASGYKVYGLAPTGRAARNLEEIGINAQTLHKFLKDYAEGRCQYRQKSVFILDEAGMVDVRRFNELLMAAHHLGVKLVISGDGAQAQPIEAGAGFRLVTNRLGVQKMDTIIRQQVDWQREATRLFGTYQTKEALTLYLDKGHVTFVDEPVVSLEKRVLNGQHRDVVDLYNLARRVAGHLWHHMTEDLKDRGIADRDVLKHVGGHMDFRRFKQWQKLRQRVACAMILDIATYRDVMQQQGVDPASFVSPFVSYDLSADDRAERVRSLIALWELKEPDLEQPLHVCDPRPQTRTTLIQAWADSVKEHPEQSHLILTYTNKNTTRLNDEARSWMRRAGRLATQEHIHTTKRARQDDFGRPVIHLEPKAFAVGERLVFTRNDKSLDVKNGTLGTVVEMNQDKLKVKIDGEDRVVAFSSHLNPYFDQGWAITIIKAQGSTADRVFKLATHEEDRNLAYVAMTRHRESLAVFGSKLDFWRDEIFIKRLSQAREKLSSLDYLLQNEARDRLTPPAPLTDALASLGNKLASWGYTSRKSWEALSATFTGQRHRIEDFPIVLTPTFEETMRARQLGLMMSNPQETGSFATHGSGGNNSGSSTSLIIPQDISAFVDHQAGLDAARAGHHPATADGQQDPFIPSRPPHAHSPSSGLSVSSVEDAKALYQRYQIQQQSQPVTGTCAALYLQRQGISASHISDLRFHSKVWHAATQQTYPTLVALARDPQGHIKALHHIYLDPITGDQTIGVLSQETRGVVRGSYVKIQEGQGCVRVVQEIDAALQLHASGVSGSIYAALNAHNLNDVAFFLHDKRQPVVVYGDAQEAAVQKSLDTLKAQGFTASIASLPRKIQNQLQPRGLEVVEIKGNTPDFLKQQSLSRRQLQNSVVFSNALLTSEHAFDVEAASFDLSAKRFMAEMVVEKVVFTAQDLERVVLKHVKTDPIALTILRDRVAQGRGVPVSLPEVSTAKLPGLVQAYTQDLLNDQDANIQRLGHNAKGVEIYACAADQQQEQDIRLCLETLKGRSASSFDLSLIHKATDYIEAREGLTYSEEQKSAIEAFYQPHAVRMLTGQAGTGKTSVLKPVVTAYQAAGYTVFGTSFQGRVADMLSHELNIEGFTLHQLMSKWQERSLIQEKMRIKDLSSEDGQKILSLSEAYQLTDRHVVIVDEANMVPGVLWQDLLKAVESSGALLRIVGDNNQIKALEGSDMGRLIQQELGSVTLTNVYRQQVTWQRDATQKLNGHQITAGLNLYQNKDHFKYQASAFSARYSLVQDYLAGCDQFLDQSHMMLAYRKQDVSDLNIAVRVRLKAKNRLTQEQTFGADSSMPLSLAIGEKVMFTRNDHHERRVRCVDRGQSTRYGVKNGTLGTVMSFDEDRIVIRTQDDRVMSLDVKRYQDLSYAYATTLHKAEGATYDYSYGLYDKAMKANHVLIWASRHRRGFTAYIDQSETPDFKNLTQSVNKSAYRGLATEGALFTEGRDALDQVKTYCDHLKAACLYRDQAMAARAQEHDAAAAALDQNVDQKVKHSTSSELWDLYHEAREDAQTEAQNILGAWQHCAPFVQQAGIARDTLEFQALTQENPWTRIQEIALQQVDTYHAQVAQIVYFRRKFNKIEMNSPDMRLAYRAMISTRNAMAYDMISFPDLYYSLLRFTKDKNDTFYSMSDKDYSFPLPSFCEVQDQARDHLDVTLIAHYDAAPDLDSRLALGMRLLSRLRAMKGVQRVQEKLRFERQWVQDHPLCSFEDLKSVAAHYDALSQGHLNAHGVATVCHHFLGTPRLEQETQLRYGRGHHLSISLQAGKAGLWYDFKSGERGELTQLVQQHQGGSREDVKRAIVTLLQQASQGLETRLIASHAFLWDPLDLDQSFEEDTAKQEKRAAFIKNLVPLAGTVADRYLKTHRHLPTARPDDIMYHAPCEARDVAAMVVLGRNQTGEVSCLQETYLDQRTAKKANFETAKRSQGQICGAYGCVQKGQDLFILAEGAETALSLKEAGLPGDIYITFGIFNFARFGSFTSDRSRPVIIAADNDGDNAQTQKQLQKAVSILTHQGFKVYIVAPEAHKADYNDVLQQGGVNAVRACFKEVAQEIGFTFISASKAPKTITNTAMPAAVSSSLKDGAVIRSAIPSSELPKATPKNRAAPEPAPVFKEYESKPFYHTEDVDRYLQGATIEYVCTRLLTGLPKGKSRGRNLRYGKDNHFSISLDTGLWTDFKSGDKGNLYKLVMRERGMTFKEAVDYLGDHVGASKRTQTYTREVRPYRSDKSDKVVEPQVPETEHRPMDDVKGASVTTSNQEPPVASPAAVSSSIKDEAVIGSASSSSELPKATPKNRAAPEPAPVFKEYESKPFYHTEDVDRYLQGATIEYVCTRLLTGLPKGKSRGRNLRYGKDNHFSISLDTGLWTDFKSGDKDNLYQLVMRERGMTFKEAVDYLGDHVGASKRTQTYTREVRPYRSGKSDKVVEPQVPKTEHRPMDEVKRASVQEPPVAAPVFENRGKEEASDDISQPISSSLAGAQQADQTVVRRKRIQRAYRVSDLARFIDQHQDISNSYKEFYSKKIRKDPDEVIKALSNASSDLKAELTLFLEQSQEKVQSKKITTTDDQKKETPQSTSSSLAGSQQADQTIVRRKRIQRAYRVSDLARFIDQHQDISNSYKEFYSKKIRKDPDEVIKALSNASSDLKAELTLFLEQSQEKVQSKKIKTTDDQKVDPLYRLDSLKTLIQRHGYISDTDRKIYLEQVEVNPDKTIERLMSEIPHVKPDIIYFLQTEWKKSNDTWRDQLYCDDDNRNKWIRHPYRLQTLTWLIDCLEFMSNDDPGEHLSQIQDSFCQSLRRFYEVSTRFHVLSKDFEEKRLSFEDATKVLKSVSADSPSIHPSSSCSQQTSLSKPADVSDHAPTIETKTEKIADQLPVVAVDEARQREQVQIPTKEVTVDLKRGFQATMLNDIATFVMLTDKVNQYDILNDRRASREIFTKLETIAGQWHEHPEFIDHIKRCENSSAVMLARDYIAKHSQNAEVKMATGASVIEQDPTKLAGDVQRFLELTKTVNQYQVLNDPQASKQIFEELRHISDGWQNNPEFMERIKKSDNNSAIRLAQDYACEQERSQNRTQSITFEI